MAAHVFHEIYLHLTWHTKGSRPPITPELELEVFEFLRARCAKTKKGFICMVSVARRRTFIWRSISSLT